MLDVFAARAKACLKRWRTKAGERPLGTDKPEEVSKQSLAGLFSAYEEALIRQLREETGRKKR